LNDPTDYSQYPAAAGINYWDEPFEPMFGRLGQLAAEHVQTYGDKLLFYVN
jgi:hypothetical protein